VIPDADVFVCPDFLEKILVEHERYDDLVVYFRRYDQSGEDTDPITLGYLNATCYLEIPTNYGGYITIRKKWMLAVNGYEQHPIFQGNNFTGGKDLYTRLRNIGMAIKLHPSEKPYHPWHPNPKLKRMNREKVAAQQECIKRRERSLMVLPYQGLDSRLDSEPDWLPAWLNQWHRTQQRRSIRGWPLRLVRRLTPNSLKVLFSSNRHKH